MGFQIGAGFIDHKSGQEGLQIGAPYGISNRAKRFQVGAGITNRSKRDYKPGQGLQIGAEQLPELCSKNHLNRICIRFFSFFHLILGKNKLRKLYEAVTLFYTETVTLF